MTTASAPWQGAAGHDVHRGALAQLSVRQPPRGHFLEDLEFRRVVAGHDRVAVDRRARQARQIGVGQDVLGQDAAARVQQVHGFVSKRLRAGKD